MIVNFADASIVKARIVARGKDGSVTVRVPITVRTPAFNVGMTSGGAGKDEQMALTREMLKEMESNFPGYGAPVSTGFDDEAGKGHGRRMGGAQAAFIESLKLEGDVLWAAIWVCADRAGEVAGGRWRGYSIEATLDKERPPVDQRFKGWVLTGGTFTNNPAFNINYKIAASVAAVGKWSPARVVVALTSFRLAEEPNSRPTASFSRREPGGTMMPAEDTNLTGDAMITLATHEQRVQDYKRHLALAGDERDNLKTRLEAATSDVSRLRNAHDEAQSSLAVTRAERDSLRTQQTTHDATVAGLKKTREVLQEKVNDLTDRLAAAEADVVGQKVTKLINKAIKEHDVDPALFEGWEAAPADWVRATFSSVDAFENHVRTLCGTARPVRRTSPSSTAEGDARSQGAASGKDGVAVGTQTSAIELTVEEKAVFDRLKIGAGEFVGVTTEAEAKKRWETMQTAKKSKN